MTDRVRFLQVCSCGCRPRHRWRTGQIVSIQNHTAVGQVLYIRLDGAPAYSGWIGVPARWVRTI